MNCIKIADAACCARGAFFVFWSLCNQTHVHACLDTSEIPKELGGGGGRAKPRDVTSSKEIGFRVQESSILREPRCSRSRK